ncbi:hypothetical protein HYQ46_009103 [Verticillium longisporum]|nr:hypothetical protein HYQ46_009103 [Verticillium longisporum]
MRIIAGTKSQNVLPTELILDHLNWPSDFLLSPDAHHRCLPSTSIASHIIFTPCRHTYDIADATGHLGDDLFESRAPRCLPSTSIASHIIFTTCRHTYDIPDATGHLGDDLFESFLSRRSDQPSSCRRVEPPTFALLPPSLTIDERRLASSPSATTFFRTTLFLMTAVANPPSFQQVNRSAWNINGGQNLNSMNSDDVRGMFMPRKPMQRSNSSSSISSTSSASSTTTVATNGSQSNGAPSTNSDMSSWSSTASRKRCRQGAAP